VWTLGLAAWLAAGAAALGAADHVLVEDWSAQPVGTKGIPAPWQKQSWGSPAYDFTVVEEDGRRVLHLRSAGDSSTMSRDIKGRVQLKETPILEWSWKAITLPRGADARRKETDDQAAQLYVTWPRFPEAVRSRIIGYIWDTTAPAGSVFQSQKTGTVTYIVLRSGPADLGRWLTERRNVREDFRRLYGEEPDNPAVISFGIDSDDVRGTAESYMGAIRFRRP
jgi:hypothetical protein